MLGYERHSETERVSVYNDGVNNQNRLKIQSDPSGNIREFIVRWRRDEYARTPECIS